MEHRGRPNRIAESSAGPETGASGASVFRRRTAVRAWDNLSDPGSISGRSQHPGGDHRSDRAAANSQSDEPLLRAAKQRRKQSGTQELNDSRRAKRSGAPPTAHRDIIEALNTAVALLDPNLLITELNPAAENLLGISRRRASGQPFMPLVDDDNTLAATLAKTLATETTFASELTLARSDVHAYERTIEICVSSIQLGDAPKQLLIEMTDVTRRTRINRENALLIQHGAGRQMIRQLAHEIKNPLGGLRGSAQLLARQLASAELREYTDVIISEADRLAALVDTLLGPGGPPRKQPANVHELLEYVIRLLEPELGANLELIRDYDTSLPKISLDRDQIIQALINLVRNAAAALEGRGRIVFRTRATMSFTIGETRHRVIASIEIEDDGPGIPPELQDSIFYPLVTSRPEGTGLGLPVAQELLSRHDGLIES